MRGKRLISIPTATQLNDFLIIPSPFRAPGTNGTTPPGFWANKKASGSRAEAAYPARPKFHPHPLPQLATRNPSLPRLGRPAVGRPEGLPEPLRSRSVKLARSGRQGPSSGRRAPGIILPSRAFPQVTSYGASTTPWHQPPRTPDARTLARKARAREAHARASPRACASQLPRQEHPLVPDTPMRMRTSCSRLRYSCVPRSLLTSTPNSQSLSRFSMAWKAVSSNFYLFFLLSPSLISPLHVLPFNSIYILFAYRLSSLTRM